MDEKTNKILGLSLMRLGSGDISAIKDIYEIMCRILYAIGGIYYSQRADIEDSIQNLLMILYTKSKKFKENKNACAWIIKVYENSIKNNLKRSKREILFGDRIIVPNPVVDEQYLENHILIKELFDKLNKQEQMLFIYYYWSKLSINEIAEILKQPKSTTHYQIQKLENKLNNLK